MRRIICAFIFIVCSIVERKTAGSLTQKFLRWAEKVGKFGNFNSPSVRQPYLIHLTLGIKF